MILLIILTFTFIAFLDAPKLWRDKHIKDLIMYLTIWSLALMLAILLTFDIEIPSPAKAVTKLLNPFIPK